jgi:CheY-like chemotaxis protein
MANQPTPRILIADDELTNRELLYRILRGYGEIIEAANGRHALDLIENEPFDVVVLDALMPGLTGMEVLKMIRAMPQHAHLPVIFVSELSENDESLRGVPIDPADYIMKPIDVDVLQARVEAHLNKGG